MQDLVFVETRNELKGIRPLLEAWCDVVLDYSRSACHLDNCWWHTERALVGTLAGAAWRLRGWSSLEEYSTTKRISVPESGIGDANERSGRCDLYLAHGSTTFAVEAKRAWQSAGSKAQDGNVRVREGMQLAWNDVGRLTKLEADVRVAATFVVPYIPRAQVLGLGGRVDRYQTRQSMETWLNGLRTDKKMIAHAFAGVFPKDGAVFLGKGDRNVFPGVVLILRRRLKGTKKAPG